MLEFLTQYGSDILAALVSVTAVFTSIIGLAKSLKIGKKVDTNAATTQQEIQITREGIVEAFKTAKIPTEWKVTVSNQLMQQLNKFRDDFIIMFKEQEELRTKLMVAAVKILNYTAASNKLTENEKQEINELIKMITDEDATIDITK